MESFNKILVLVDFSTVSLHAAEEAATIASRFKSELHLLHVSPGSALLHMLLPEAYFFHGTEDDATIEHNNMYKLEKLKAKLLDQFVVDIICHEIEGGFKETINEYIYLNSIDLLVLGCDKKRGFKNFLSDSLAEKIIDTVNCEVLSVSPESDCRQLKNIVIPVGAFVPKRKISLAYVLSKKFAANIHLIALTEYPGRSTKVLLAAYHYFRDITNIPVECKTVAGTNIAQAAVQYAKNINADMILINPGKESHFPGNIFQKWGKDIMNYTTVPVLSVHSILSKTRTGLYPT